MPFLIPVGASIVGGILSSRASNNAANTQAAAANRAAELDRQSAQEAIAEQRRQFDISQTNMRPWLQSGAGALMTLNDLLGISTPGFSTGSIPSITSAGSIPSVTGGTPYQPGLPGEKPAVTQSLPDWIDPNQPINEQVDAYIASQKPGSEYFIHPESGIPGAVDPGTGWSYPLPSGTTYNPIPEAGQMPSNEVPYDPYLGVQGGDVPFGLLLQDIPLNLPTNFEDLAIDPAFQFRMDQGQRAIERSAAARGGHLGGGTLLDLEDYSQRLSSEEYMNAWNRAVSNALQQFNATNTNRSNLFNRLSGLAGTGQTTAQNLSDLGMATATNIGNLTTGSGARQGDYMTQAANARAAGTVAGANAWNNALGTIGTSLYEGLNDLRTNRGSSQSNRGSSQSNDDLGPDEWFV